MGIAQLFFKKGNFISTVQLDIIISESATATVKKTQNPVESGADVNDHLIINPISFTTKGVVSDISANLIGQFTRIPAVFSQSTTKSKEAWEALLKLQSEKTVFTLIQGLKEYKNVVILSLSEDQDKDTAKGLFFTAQMEEFIFVGAEIIVAEQFNDESIADKMIKKITGGLKQLKSVVT